MTTPIGCADAVRRLWTYLDGELESTDEEAFEAHLSWCLRCCGELDFARELRSMLERRSGGELPADAKERLECFIELLGEPSEGATSG